MAGEWIKIEVGTPDKPEVIRIARILKQDRDLVFGKLCRLWSWFDRNSVDGTVDGVVSTDVDDVVGMKGFMAALKVVNWCGFDDTLEKVWLVNFDAHNGETAKQRAQKNKRQAKWRKGSDGSVDEPASTSASTREEKRRNKKTTFSSEDMRLAEFILEGVLQVSPDFKKPKTLDKWANTIRLMREQDKLEHRHIAEVFKFANLDSFWKTNILSPEKLREKFAQLSAKKLEATNGQRNQHSRPSKSQSDEQALRDYHAELAAQEAALVGVASFIEPSVGVGPGGQH